MILKEKLKEAGWYIEAPEQTIARKVA